MKTFIVIPAFNEATVISKVLNQLKEAGYKNVLVVNDGSSDKTGEILQRHGVHVAEHLLNRGLGGALGTGLAGALKLGADIIITFDADGQHSVHDIPKMIEPIKNKEADAVIGSRTMNPDGMPMIRRAFNFVANIITLILFRIWVTDSQSGLRAFSRKAAQAIEIRTNRMEVSSEFIREIKHKKLRLKEVPIKAIYTDYSLSKGQSFWVGVKTFYKLVIYKLMN
jgi:UDP-N-acetylglucosamine---dolichyl-phosphate N-acetylglucosaminyltransferase